MLYAHALESIFAFATLRELAALMSICRKWQAAVLSMQPAALSLISSDFCYRYHRREIDTMTPLCALRLRCHVAHLGSLLVRVKLVDCLGAAAVSFRAQSECISFQTRHVFHVPLTSSSEARSK